MAAALTYYLVLAIFPALIIVAGLLGAIGLSPQSIDALLDAVAEVGPGWAVGLVQGALRRALDGWRTGRPRRGCSARVVDRLQLRVGLSLDGGADGGPSAAIVLPATPYAVGPGGLLLVLLTACGATIVLAGPVANWLGDLLGLGDAVLTAWSWLKWPFLFGVALLMLLLLFHTAAQPGTRWRRRSEGRRRGGHGARRLRGLQPLSDPFASYNKVYGALATGIAFLVWAWLVNVAALLGFLLMVALERNARRSGWRTDEARS